VPVFAGPREVLSGVPRAAGLRMENQMAFGDMSHSEQKRRSELEAIVRKGLDTFVDVGDALTELRDSGLYKSTHATFEAYVKDEFRISRSYAYRMIAGTKTVKRLPDKVSGETETLSPTGDKVSAGTENWNERQARALAGVPDDIMPDVIAKAEEIAGDKKVTAKVIEQAKEEVLDPKPEAPKQTALEAIQADFAALEKLVRDAKNFALKAFKPWNEENMSTRDFCKGVSNASSVGHLNEYLRWLKDLTPIGGTPKRPETNRSRKAAEARAQ
jgi:hypothetical protein